MSRVCPVTFCAPDTADYELLVEAIRPQPSPLDIDVVIGMKGPIAPPELCNGLMIPVVAFDQIYSFDRDALIKARDFSLTGVNVFPSALSGTRRILEVIFSYSHRTTGFTDKWFVRVDVTDEFPFLVTKIAPYYHR